MKTARRVYMSTDFAIDIQCANRDTVLLSSSNTVKQFSIIGALLRSSGTRRRGWSVDLPCGPGQGSAARARSQRRNRQQDHDRNGEAIAGAGGVKLLGLMSIPHGQETRGLDGQELLEPSHDQNSTDHDNAEWQPSQHRVSSVARLRRCACGRAVAYSTRQKVGAATKLYPRPLRAKGF